MARHFSWWRLLGRAFLAALLSGGSAGAASFIQVPVAVDPMRASSVAWGDYDNDRDLDLLIAGRNNSNFESSLIYRKRSTGEFTNIFLNLSANDLHGDEMATTGWADFDAEGDLDVLLAGRLASRLYRNDGSGVFTFQNGAIPDGGGGRAVAGDFNNDGRLDVFVMAPGVGSIAGDTALMLNRGGFVFERHPGAGIEAHAQPTLAAADYDGDGDLDMLVAGRPVFTGYDCAIYQNDGRGNFQRLGVGLPGFVSGAAAWGDMDNDGDPDLISGGTVLSGGLLQVYRNDGIEFEEAGVALPQLQHPAAAWADYDNDGWLDFAVSGWLSGTNTTQLYHNQRDGTFTNVLVTLPGMHEGSLTWADENADGRLDLLILGADYYVQSIAALMRNQGGPTNRPPTAPAGLGAAVWGTSVTLNWAAATDANQSGALSYNLRVGTTPSGQEVMPALASLSTCFRRVVAPGNAGTRLSHTLTNLAPGTYYWSVQAVDHAFAGGPFATGSSFVVAHPPVISSIPDLTLSPGVPSAPIAFTISDVESPAANLIVTAGTSNEALVAAAGLALGGTGASRQLVITPQPGQLGEVTLTLTVTDPDGGQAQTSFLVRIVNQPPVLTVAPADIRVLVGAEPPLIQITLGDPDSALANLTLSVESTNPWLLPTEALTLEGTGTNRTLKVELLPGVAGYTYINLLLRDEFGAEAFTAVRLETYYEPPTIAGPTAPVALWPGEWSPELTFTVDDDLTAPELISFTAHPSNSSLITFDDIVVTSSGNQRKLRFRSQPWARGEVDLFIWAVDGNGAFANLRLGVTIEMLSPIAIGPLLGAATTPARWVDVDGDGRLDLHFLEGSQHRLWRNQSSPTHGLQFSAMTNGVPAEAWNSAAFDWADFDNDGDPDLLVAGYWSVAMGETTRIYRNEGGQFVLVDPGLPGVVGGRVRWGDYNQDGWQDVLLAGQGGGVARSQMIYTNIAGQSFAPLHPAGPPEGTVFPDILDWADFANQGGLDVLATNSLALQLHFNRGGVLEPTGNELSYFGWSLLSHSVADVNGDGRLDVFISAASPYNAWNTLSTVWTNLGGNQFQHQLGEIRYRTVAHAWGDLNNDGAAELILTGDYQTGGQTYVEPFTGLIMDRVREPLNLGSAATGFTWADADGDGDQDVFCFADGVPTVLRNNSLRGNTPPSSPTGLSAAQTNDVIRLTWQPAADPDQPAGLTYNVFVRRPDGALIVSPPASTNSGGLNLAARGNAGSQAFFEVRGVPPGAYAWIVQAVDAMHATSTAPGWTNFSVQPGPVISAVADRTIRVNSSTLVTFNLSDDATAVDQLAVRVESSNPDLVAAPGLILSGAGAERSLVIQPAPDQVGSADISILVSDGVASGVAVFQLTVAASPPQVAMLEDQVIRMNAASAPVLFAVADVDYPGAVLAVSARSGNPTLVAPTGFTFGGTTTNRTVTITPVPFQIGTAELAVIVSNPAGLATTNSFLVTVIDDPPVVGDMIVATDEDVPLVITLDASDPEGVPLEVSVVTPPTAGQLAGVGPVTTYVPDLNHFGSDFFEFRVSDGRHVSAIARVDLTIHSVPDTTAGILEALPLGNGQFRLQLQAEPRRWYRIDVSSDLLTWTPWLTVRADPHGQVQQLDAVPRPMRFYRVIPLE